MGEPEAVGIENVYLVGRFIQQASQTAGKLGRLFVLAVLSIEDAVGTDYEKQQYQVQEAENGNDREADMKLLLLDFRQPCADIRVNFEHADNAVIPLGVYGQVAGEYGTVVNLAAVDSAKFFPLRNGTDNATGMGHPATGIIRRLDAPGLARVGRKQGLAAGVKNLDLEDRQATQDFLHVVVQLSRQGIANQF